MNIFSKITLQNLKKNRTRTLVTIIGILLSAAMFTAVTTTVSSLHHFMLEYTLYRDGGWYACGYELTEKGMESFTSGSQISESVSLQRLGFSRIEESQNSSKPYLCVEGIENDFTDLLPVHLTEGRMPENETELLLPGHLAENGGVEYSLGDTLTLQLGERRDIAGDLLTNHDAYVVPDKTEASYDDSEADTSVRDFPATEDTAPDNTDADAAVLDMGTETLHYTDTRTYTVVGFYERPAFEDYTAPGYTALTVAGSDSGNYAYDVYFTIHNGKNIVSFYADSEDAFPGGGELNRSLLRLYSYSGESTYNATLYSLAAILIGIIMFGSISLIYNAFSISVSERTRQFGVLASIGATKRQLRRSVITEGLFLSVVGIPLGVLAGILGMGITFYVVGDTISEFFLPDCPVTLTLYPSLQALLIAVLIALLTILISAYLPAQRAMKRSAIETIRQSNDIRLCSRQVRTSRLTRKLFGFEGMLAAKNYKRNRKKYRATVVSLFISIVLFISASSFCNYLGRGVDVVYDDYGFNVVATVWGNGSDTTDINGICSRIASMQDVEDLAYYTHISADLYVNTDALHDNYVDMLCEYEGYDTGSFEDHAIVNANVVFMDDEQFREYAEENHLNPAEYFIPSHPKAILVDRLSYYSPSDSRYYTFSAFTSLKQAELSFALVYPQGGLEYLYYSPADGQFQFIFYSEETENEISIPFRSGCDIVPINCDTVLDNAPSVTASSSLYQMYPTLYLPYSQIPYLFPSQGAPYVNLPDMPLDQNLDYEITMFCRNHTATVAAIQDYLDTCSGIGYYVNDYEEIAEKNRAIMFVINIFSYGFIILISLISMANVFNTISTNIQLRRREFAMLQSVGLDPKGMMRMMNFECLLYGFKGLLYGLPTSIFVTWLIFRAVSNGISMGFYIPWYSIAIAVGSVFAIVFATMLYSMKKIRKENTIDALKNENI